MREKRNVILRPIRNNPIGNEYDNLCMRRIEAMATNCPCCCEAQEGFLALGTVGKVSFLYDLCPECGWEYHGEPMKGIAHSEKFACVSLEDYRAIYKIRKLERVA
jgi:hypothetical protein